MEIFRKLFLLIAVVALLAGVSACAEEEEEEILKNYMYGVVDFDIPAYVPKGELVTMSADGIITPSKGVIYKWFISGVYNDTLALQKITVRFPDSLGVFSVTAYAMADDYYISSTTQTVTTIDTAFNASLKGVTYSPNSIVDSRDGKRYSYVTVGNLDWFNQNLAYMKTGVPYKGSCDVWSIFGAFYSWNEATGGESGSGLGGGPQGACPEGWSVPTSDDWADLASAIAGKDVPFIDSWDGLGSKCSADAYLNEERLWPYSPDNIHENTVGWNALPFGNSTLDKDGFANYSAYGFWWSSAEKNPEQAYYRYIYQDLGNFPVSSTSKSDFRANVRCVRMHPQS